MFKIVRIANVKSGKMIFARWGIITREAAEVIAAAWTAKYPDFNVSIKETRSISRKARVFGKALVKDRPAWQAGFSAGASNDRSCPYAIGSAEARYLAYGWFEGEAKRLCMSLR